MSAPLKRPIVIGVIGGEYPPAWAEALAEKVGELVAKRGGIIICGGLGGVMEHACAGASKAGGLSIGILPGGEKQSASPYVSIPIVTAMGTTRNTVIVRTADALIAIDGSFGTLTEIAYALDMDKVLVLLKSWQVGKLGVAPKVFMEATTAEEAVELAFDGIRKKNSEAKP
jgi:hypothetical protein